ncbi:MAG: HAMP domain-containing histidine kinase [Bacteroidota bacterium]|nr:HAMP domain-containing histidine kinase [Bacteroidota bacterium]
MLNQLGFKIFIRIFLLFVTLAVCSFLLVKSIHVYLIILVPLLIYQVSDLYWFYRKSSEELNNFVESVKYKDFSRRFDLKHAPSELRTLRKGFNQINDAFKTISKEKEMQNQYLQKILELVNTGILSYENITGEVIWMNESLKQMLELPYLKHIHSLNKRYPELYEEIIKLKSGDGKIHKVQQERSSFKVLLSATEFQTEGKKFKLIAFQNISEAVDETESKAWQKLLSVMTHEIMNSVAPISSLAGTLKSNLEKSKYQLSNSNGAVDDLELGIETIKRRSESLLKFAETYRNLNKITVPDVKTIYVRDMFENIFSLMQPSLDQKNIEMDIVLKETGLIAEVDATLIEQVLINLVVNAMEAVKGREDGRIILSAGENVQRKIYIKVADNGLGMEEEMLEKIFIPFFSTKKNGSGIGLSLCKQIMMVHKGNIQVQSVYNEGTVFTLHF